MVTGSELEDERIKWSVSGPDAKRFEIVKLPDTHNNVEPSQATKDDNNVAAIEDDAGTDDVNEATGGFFVDENGTSVAGPASEDVFMTSWADITAGTASTYTPQEEDEGYYLRATVTYSDGVGDERDTASADTAFLVEIRPTANFRPSFVVQDEKADETGIQVTRSVKETAKAGSGVGVPVVATDVDNDPLLYTLADYVPGTDDDFVDDSRWFKIDGKTGQISVATDKTLSQAQTALEQDQADADAVTGSDDTAWCPCKASDRVQG